MNLQAVQRRLRIDASYSQEIRATSVLVDARSTFDPPQLLLENSLPRRRQLRIFHFGKSGEPATNVPVVLGNPDIRWIGATDIFGFELHRLEELVLEVDETVAIYVTRRSTEAVGNRADLRILEIA